MLAARYCCIFHANANKHKQHAISGIRVMQRGQMCGLEKREEGNLTPRPWEAINQTLLVYNSDWVISLINYVWVVHETSSLSNVDQAGTDFSDTGSHQPLLISSVLLNGDWNGWSKLNREKLKQNSLRTSREGRKLDPSWNNASRRRQDVIWLLSGNSTSPIFRALICKLICGWQRQAWVWERILDVIRCLAPSSFVDWSIIGNESAAFPLWGRQGRWQLEHMDWKWVSV